MTSKLKLDEVFPLTVEDGAAWLLSHDPLVYWRMNKPCSARQLDRPTWANQGGRWNGPPYAEQAVLGGPKSYHG